MSSKEEKGTRIFRVKEQIYTVNNAGKEKYAVVKELQINRYVEIVRYPERYTYESCVKQYSRTEIKGLFEGFIVRCFGEEKGRTMKYIKRCDDFGEEKGIDQNNNSHFYISPEEKKNGRKNYMYQTQENKHVKIIQSGPEKQERRTKESQTSQKSLLKRKTNCIYRGGPKYTYRE